MRRTLAAAGLVLVAFVSGCTGDDDENDPSLADQVAAADTHITACPDQADDAAPDGDLEAITLPCFTGGSLDLGLAPGTPTVLNLWGSWCPPCRAELPLFQQLADTAGEQLRVIGVVSVDGIPQSTSFADDSGVTIPGAFDQGGEVKAALGLAALPGTVFVAADGTVAFVLPRPVASLEELESLVAQHLGVQL